MLDIIKYHAQVGDVIMLSTDGLTKSVSDIEIASILQMPVSLEERVDELIKHANEAGGRDNITVLLIEREEEVM